MLQIKQGGINLVTMHFCLRKKSLNFEIGPLPKTIEFSLNDFPWIQWIQSIMTKSKTSMVTRDTTQPATDTLPGLVIKSVYSLLLLGRYLLPLTTLNRYQPTDSSGKLLFTTVLRNISVVRYRISLVTILLLDLVMIHWIRWIQRKSFRENSNNISAGNNDDTT